MNTKKISNYIQISIVVFVFFIKASTANCQYINDITKVNLHIVHGSLESVLDSLSDKTGYLFSYDPTIVPIHKYISVRFDNKLFKDCLDEIFEQDSIHYQFANRHVILSKTIQNKPLIIQCKGRIVDALSDLPLEYATISFRGKSLGTIANAKGEFILNIPNNLQSEPIWISFVGYSTERYFIKKDTVLNIKLIPAPNLIKEVVIEYLNPKDLIHAVYDNLENNYIMSSVAMTGFYREFSRKNSDYVSITEAIVAINKSPYLSSKHDKIFILKCRKSTDVVKMDTVAYKFQGGLNSCLYLDAIKNRPSFADPEFESFYNYKLEKIQSIENENIYEIKFEQKNNTEFPFYNGKIYINAKAKAIVEIEFSLSPSGLKYASQALVVKSPFKYKVKPLQAKYRVSYRKINEKWYLSHVRSETIVNVKRRNRIFSNEYKTIAEMVITQFDTIKKTIPNEGILLKQNDIISDKILPYDTKFWGDENVIKPEESIELALKRISNQLAAWQKGKEEFELKNKRE